MKKFFIFILLSILLSLIFFSCKDKAEIKHPKISDEKLFIAIKNDVDFFNPLYSNDIVSGLINDLIFSSLTYSEFNSDSGKLIYYPNLANRWKIDKDKRSITYFLKTNLKWSDGEKFSASDVYYSYFLYTHPDVMSVRQDVERFFIHDKNGRVDYKKSFVVLNDSTIIFNFSEEVEDPLFVTGLPILPEHIFRKIPLKEIFNHEVNFNPIGIGPYKLENYSRQQQIVLIKNDSSYFDKIPFIKKLIFKVISDYNSRLNQLKKGEIDFVTDVNPADAEILKRDFSNIKVETIAGRDYDYIGWSNIDHNLYRKSNGKIIQPHPLFGKKEFRLAISMAINRKEIIDGYFGEFAELAESPISPIFGEFLNTSLETLEYNPEEAKKFLARNGWQDSDGDRILDKDGKPFRFKLTLASGKPHREFTATIIKKNLAKIGIDVEIEILETSLFFNNLFEKKLDAWIAGWTVPLNLDLEAFWGSDLNKNFFNVCSYQNPEVDKIFLKLRETKSIEEKRNLIHRFQEILQKDQPVTFLYWIDNIIAYNKKLKNTKFNPIAYTNRIWEWYIEK
jgi:peptide/nickel transport system substrate-binding protein